MKWRKLYKDREARLLIGQGRLRMKTSYLQFSTMEDNGSQFSLSVVSDSLRPYGLQHAIQPSHPLSSPSPPTFNLSQHQGIYFDLFLTALGLHCWAWAFSSCGEWGRSLQWFLLLRFTGSVVVMYWLSCSMLCGIFLDQGSNPRPLCWQADSYVPLGKSHFSHFQFPWKAWRIFLGTDLLPYWPLHQST